MKPSYRVLPDQSFEIQNYNQARPFSSFLPGIAGLYGSPMWVFYVNRGQCVSSFGIRNKNGCMLEFYPANKAYQLTPSLGFRTFYVFSGKDKKVYEPFSLEASSVASQRLIIRPTEIELIDTNTKVGLETRVVFVQPPNEEQAFITRSIEIRNISKKPVQIDVLDGLPQIVPYGLNEFLLKQMSRTMEAFAEVRHTKEELPFFKLKVEPTDKPEVRWIQGGFFAFSLEKGKSKPIITDPELVFGSDTTFQQPLGYLENPKRMLGREESLMGCALTKSTVKLLPGKSYQHVSFYGYADDWKQALALKRGLQHAPANYLDEKRKESARLIQELTSVAQLHSAVPTLNAYSRQTYLDNLLRGGKPLSLSSNPNSVFHVYTRKHGDMERDYNFFELSPTPFSQGNGNFRDVNQNRRSENWFYPEIGSSNVQTFFNLIQLDGYNPLVIESEKFKLKESAFAQLESEMSFIKADAWAAFLRGLFTPAQLYQKLLNQDPKIKQVERWMAMILDHSNKHQIAKHGEGYWVDHWFYCLDLLENYSAIYPDSTRELFLDNKTYTYYDSDHRVLPRQRKYVLNDQKQIRQLGAVEPDVEKRRLIHSRSEFPHHVRAQHGKGDVFYTTLFVKLVGLFVIKAATLDSEGRGIEMEADKPGWCDALNGMPAVLGSSINESLQLLRGVRWLKSKLDEILEPGQTHPFPEEIRNLLIYVTSLLRSASPDNFFSTWNQLASHREAYRDRVRFGLSGQQLDVSRSEIDSFLNTVDSWLTQVLPQTRNAQGLYQTYFRHEATEYDVSTSGGGQTIQVKALKAIPITPFLEGPMHALHLTRTEPEALAIYRSVKQSGLYDRKIKMFRLNMPLEKESDEIGRSKTFTPGWLENESVFLHMAYKFLYATLKSGLVEEFYDDFRSGLVAFLKPETYGRSPFENSSFIASSRFPDARVHGAGFVARLTGAAAEWISMLIEMGIGSRPFRAIQGQLQFQPEPKLARWLFSQKAENGFEKNTFGFQLFGSTWIIYHNPKRRDTYGPQAVRPVRIDVEWKNGKKESFSSASLPDAPSRALRAGELRSLQVHLDF